jgi:hypothetical protein
MEIWSLKEGVWTLPRNIRQCLCFYFPINSTGPPLESELTSEKGPIVCASPRVRRSDERNKPV